MLVLSQVFKRRNYSINDIFDFNVPGKFLKFEAGNAADFGFNIIDVFDDVGQKSLEAFFAHRIGQIANFCYQFVSDSPWELIWNEVEIRLEGCWRFDFCKFDDSVYQKNLIGLLFVFEQHFNDFHDDHFIDFDPVYEIAWVHGSEFPEDDWFAFSHLLIQCKEIVLIGRTKVPKFLWDYHCKCFSGFDVLKAPYSFEGCGDLILGLFDIADLH